MLHTWAMLPDAVRRVLASAHHEMCRALDDEMAAQEKPPVDLPRGERLDIPTAATGQAYRFQMPAPGYLRESDSVECRFVKSAVPGSDSYKGLIAHADDQCIVIAFCRDFGPAFPAGATLIPRECSAYVEAQDRLRSIEAGAESLNADIALHMIGAHRLSSLLSAHPPTPTPIPAAESLEHLRLSQQLAIDSFLARTLAALWGPPGTGKTVVLAAGVAQRARHGAITTASGTVRRPRTLVLGPTNFAVDEAVARIANHFRDLRSAREPAVVRFGPNVTAQLVVTHGDQVVFDRIVRRIRGHRMRRAVEVAARLEMDLEVLEETSDLLRNVPLELEDEREKLVRQHRHHRHRADRMDRISREHARRFELALRRPSAIEREILSGCGVLGTTVHQALMSHRIQESQWDCVVIDEASQVPFALAYAAATMARETAWIVGDPRQLGPVVRTSTRLGRAWMARDAFAVSDSVRDEPSGTVVTAPWVSRLDWQHRMHPEICAVVQGAYGDTLRTEPTVERSRRAAAVRLPFAHAHHPGALYLVDTTSLQPTASRAKGGSRVNRTHVAVVRALVELLDENGLLGTEGKGTPSIGVISPYVAQARWLARVLHKRFPNRAVRCSTIHAYQGQEVDTVILDLTEASGLDVTDWMRASTWADDGGRLITVACSRARQRLFVLADCEHLYRQLEELAPRPVVYRWLRYLEHWAGGVDVERDIVARARERRQPVASGEVVAS